MMTRAKILAQQTKLAESLKAVDEAIAFAPESPLVPRIKGFRKQIESMQKAEEKAAKKDAEPAGQE